MRIVRYFMLGFIMQCISRMHTYSQVSTVIKKNLRKIAYVNNQGLYDLLRVAVGANENEVKRGYKRQALLHHPDKGGNPELFKRIQDAHEVLMGPLRAQCDACGEEGLDLKKQAEAQARHLMCRDQNCFVLFIVIIGALSRIQLYVRRPRL